MAPLVVRLLLRHWTVGVARESFPARGATTCGIPRCSCEMCSVPSHDHCCRRRCLQMQPLPRGQAYSGLLGYLLQTIYAGRSQSSYLEMCSMSVSQVQALRCTTRGAGVAQSRRGRWLVVLFDAPLSSLSHLSCDAQTCSSDALQVQVRCLDLQWMQS